MAKILKSPVADQTIPIVTVTEHVFSTLARTADRVALFDQSGRSYTAKQVYGAARKVAASLHAKGLKKGDVLCIFAPNLPEYAIALHGCAQLGVIVTTCNPLYTARELLYQLNDANATYVLTIALFMDKVKEAVAEHGRIKEVFVFGEAEGATPFASLLKTADEPPKVEINPKEDIFIIPYSSGTTGLAKGVVLTHYNVVANIIQTKAVEKDYTMDDVFMGVLPFFHMYAMIVILNLALHEGVKTVIMPKFDLVEFLKLAQDHRASYLHIVPPIVLALAKHPIVAQYDLSSVRVIMSAAAPLSADVEKEMRTRFPSIKIKQAYGLSETSPALSVSPSDCIKPGAAGLLLPNLEVKVVDPVTGAMIDHHTDGELCFRGPNIMKCYLNNPTSTAATIDSDGFLHSGDIGHVDDDCHLFIVDRAKELIKYKGYQVAPAELEGLLLSHHSVADAAVIGVPDDEAGELPKAFVVLKPNQTISSGELIHWLDNQVAPHKKLRGGLEFIDKIPKSLSGKILRRELKAAELAKRKL